ncbi:hypothetical protein [Pelomonas sp. SE-A7]|uniref:hypothetical protein n=1 Tax=Pelomonas sp. SE-A7 TaxID=3054953 RepID=UPI00259C7A51|nr:hypothetical protein [Pelomonas sp. SE-A7]MDM4768261.1 hypothetical protein [Pelomonas sp. SE-A7]
MMTAKCLAENAPTTSVGGVSMAGELPIWVEYVKALGTPSAALLAAAIAGYFAYRQWRTAQNKLKLDLFERRLAVHDAAVSLILKGTQNLTADDVAAFLKAVANARWLFKQPVVDFLKVLQNDALRDLRVQEMAIDEEPDPIKDALEFLTRLEGRATDRMRVLTMLMKDDLTIRH